MIPRLNIARVRALVRLTRTITPARLTSGCFAQPRHPQQKLYGIAHQDGTFSYIEPGVSVHHRKVAIPNYILDQMPADEAARLRRAGASS